MNGNEDHKITFCHNGHEITIDKHAYAAHLKNHFPDDKDSELPCSPSQSTTTTSTDLSTTTTTIGTTSTSDPSTTQEPSSTIATSTTLNSTTTVPSTESITPTTTVEVIVVDTVARDTPVDSTETTNTSSQWSSTSTVGHTGNLPATGYGSAPITAIAAVAIITGGIMVRMRRGRKIH